MLAVGCKDAATPANEVDETGRTPIIKDILGNLHADGFDEIYGDYGEIAITSKGKTIGVWGEGISYYGPGGVWFNIQK